MRRNAIIGLVALLVGTGLLVALSAGNGTEATGVSPSSSASTSASPTASPTEPTTGAATTVPGSASPNGGSEPAVTNEPEVVPFLVETTVGSVKPAEVVDPDSVPDPYALGETPPPGYRQLLERDGILPVYRPVFVTAGETEWPDDSYVLGLEIDGDARAYPIGYLTSREMVIDRVAGIPVLVTW